MNNSSKDSNDTKVFIVLKYQFIVGLKLFKNPFQVILIVKVLMAVLRIFNFWQSLENVPKRFNGDLATIVLDKFVHEIFLSSHVNDVGTLIQINLNHAVKAQKVRICCLIWLLDLHHLVLLISVEFSIFDWELFGFLGQNKPILLYLLGNLFRHISGLKRRNLLWIIQ